MKTTIRTTLILLAAVLLTGCFRNDTRTEIFQIEQLRNEQGARLVAASLRGLPGIKDIRADIGNKKVIVVFDGRQMYLKNIEYAIVNAGFDLPHWPATDQAKAKLPEELR